MIFKVGQYFRNGNVISKIISITLEYQTSKYNPRFGWMEATSTRSDKLDQVDTKTVVTFDKNNRIKRTNEYQGVRVHHGKTGQSWFNIGKNWIKDIEDNYEVSDVPQDLVREGDLVLYSEGYVANPNERLRVFNKSDESDKNHIIKIWTPDENNYIFQWEKENN